MSGVPKVVPSLFSAERPGENIEDGTTSLFIPHALPILALKSFIPTPLYSPYKTCLIYLFARLYLLSGKYFPFIKSTYALFASAK